MLTKEVIQANETLKTLTDDQLAAIVTLSQNDEANTISAKIGEVHRQYDADIRAVTGQEKPGGVKTYDFLKTVLSDLKAKAESGGGDLQKQMDALKAEKADLEKKIKEGAGDAALKAKVTDMEKALGDKDTQIKQLQGKIDETKTEWQKKLEEAQGAATRLRIDNEFDRALQGVKFKDEKIIPPSLRDLAIQNAKAAILTTATPDWIDDGNGGRRLVFRNKEGQVMNNPENKLNPFTAGELLIKNLTEIIDTGKQQNGAGTNGSTGPGAGGSASLELTGVKTQVEASEVIRKHLMSLGKVRGTQEFTAEETRLWAENKVAELPVR